MAEAYYHAWEGLSPKQALVNLAEQNLQQALSSQPRFDKFDPEYSMIHESAEEAKEKLEQEVNPDRERIEKELTAVPGAAVEDKYASATVHYRRADTTDSSVVIATVQAVVEGTDGLTMDVDDQIVEIRPEIEQRKGEAVTELVDIETETALIYLGDAQTDVDAFDTLAELSNETISISVGDTLPARGYHLDSPEDVETFLGWLASELGRKA
jgi:trehalose-phosphatase